MSLKLTLKPFEKVVINGCMMRNGGRKTTMSVESRADIIRETDLLKPAAVATPVTTAYFLVQNALTDPERRDDFASAAQKQLAALATVFVPPHQIHAFEAANCVSTGDFFRALRHLRPLLEREAEILGDGIVPAEAAGDSPPRPRVTLVKAARTA
ncbi:flagellar biosynthesis repressor FlbT [Pseudooceanicola aestuarii]|uniref:flagellar biosynthesis repressor FlbT n=1 Tax=Pseudooceanicola aestuarii TaxID=2697319 RepID=UPI0013D39CBA|nr:flagellar biosynthesis repressor FlbT [Pseudooceanicola aestuarii]